MNEKPQTLIFSFVECCVCA